MKKMGLVAIYPKPSLSNRKGVSVFAQRPSDRFAESCLERGYHVYPDEQWIHVPDGGDRLV